MITIRLVNEVKDIQSTCSPELKELLTKALQQGILEGIDKDLAFIKEYVSIEPIKPTDYKVAFGNKKVKDCEPPVELNYEKIYDHINLDKLKIGSWVLIKRKQMDGQVDSIVGKVKCVSDDLLTVGESYDYVFNNFGRSNFLIDQLRLSIIGINCSENYVEYKKMKKEVL